MATKQEKDRLNKISQMGCFCCGRPAEVHHIRSHNGLSVRPSHFDTIPLCEMHHRLGKDSIHLGKKLFIEKYGDEQMILKQVNKQLKLMEDAYNLFNKGENNDKF